MLVGILFMAVLLAPYYRKTADAVWKHGFPGVVTNLGYLRESWRPVLAESREAVRSNDNATIALKTIRLPRHLANKLRTPSPLRRTHDHRHSKNASKPPLSERRNEDAKQRNADRFGHGHGPVTLGKNQYPAAKAQPSMTQQ